MSSSLRIVAGLIAGLIAGIALSPVDGPAVESAAAAFALVGELWLNGLRMTVLPLIVALLVTGIAATRDTAASGRLAGRALAAFAVVIAASSTLPALVMPLVLEAWPVSPAARAALLAGVDAGAPLPTQPPLRDWFAGIVPVNPFGAAADGAILPLVVFTLLFGLAVARLEPARRAPLVGFFQAVADATLILVHWVLWAAPLGVFALALGVGRQGGVAAAGALGQYTLLMCALAVVVTLAMYPVAALFGGTPTRRFAAAVAPAQAVAFSTQSSLACLPALLAGAQERLGLSRRVSGVVLPLAVSVFKATSPALNLAVVIFVAHVTGVPLDPWRLVLGVAVAFLTSFGVAGVPGQASFLTTTVPISAVMGVPMELLLLLLAIEVIPDIFRTVGNVTADLAVTAVVARREGAAAAEPEESAEPAHG